MKRNRCTGGSPLPGWWHHQHVTKFDSLKTPVCCARPCVQCMLLCDLATVSALHISNTCLQRLEDSTGSLRRQTVCQLHNHRLANFLSSINGSQHCVCCYAARACFQFPPQVITIAPASENVLAVTRYCWFTHGSLPSHLNVTQCVDDTGTS